MAAPYNPPVKGQDFVLRVSLSDMAVAGSFRSNPTIAAGDFKVDKDGAGLVNLTTLPVVQPAGSVLVLITLSAAEMNADVVTVVGIDQTVGKEWADFVLSIPTVLPGELPTPLSTTAILMPSDAATITMGAIAGANGDLVIANEDGWLSMHNEVWGAGLTLYGSVEYGAELNIYGANSSYTSPDGTVFILESGLEAGIQYYALNTYNWGAAPAAELYLNKWNFNNYVTSTLTTYEDNAIDIGLATPVAGKGRPRSIFAGTSIQAAVGMAAGALASATTRLLLAAGTTAISSMRMLAGVAPTAPVDGDIWFTGTSLQMRVGGVTKTITMT